MAGDSDIVSLRITLRYKDLDEFVATESHTGWPTRSEATMWSTSATHLWRISFPCPAIDDCGATTLATAGSVIRSCRNDRLNKCHVMWLTTSSTLTPSAAWQRCA